MWTRVQEASFKSVGVIGFLRHLLCHIPGKLVIVWDGAPIHKSKEIKAFLQTAEGRRIHLERLPGYAPELNADEGVWQHLKNQELKNVCCGNLQELRRELRKATERLRHKKHIIKSFFTAVGY